MRELKRVQSHPQGKKTAAEKSPTATATATEGRTAGNRLIAGCNQAKELHGGYSAHALNVIPKYRILPNKFT